MGITTIISAIISFGAGLIISAGLVYILPTTIPVTIRPKIVNQNPKSIEPKIVKTKPKEIKPLKIIKEETISPPTTTPKSDEVVAKQNPSWPPPPLPEVKRDLLVKDIINVNTVIKKGSIEEYPDFYSKFPKYFYIGSFMIQADEFKFISKIEYETDILSTLQIETDDGQVIPCIAGKCIPGKNILADGLIFNFQAHALHQTFKSYFIKLKSIELIEQNPLKIYYVGGLPTINPNFTFTISQ